MTSQPLNWRVRARRLPTARLIATALCLAIAGAGVGCSQQLSAAPAADDKSRGLPSTLATPPTALARIEQLIGSAACETDSQCQAAGIGERPCGGAESYRAWSTASTQAKAMEETLLAYAQERLRWHEKVGVMSTCEIRPVPAARCERTSSGAQPGRCVLSGAATELR